MDWLRPTVSSTHSLTEEGRSSLMAESLASEDTRHAASRALERATSKLLSLQHESGYWKAELETNVTMDAEELLLREFLGIRDAERTKLTAAWIRSQQREDGGFAIYHGGPVDLSATLEAYVALRIAGDSEAAPHMKRAYQQIMDRGGIEASRVFTRIWMALFGAYSWDELPALPPEVVLLPAWFPLNIYDFASWARQTIVPLTVVASHRPVRALPFDLQLRKHPHLRKAKAPFTRLGSWAGRFNALDRGLHAYERHPIGLLRSHARSVAREWIVRRQEADGCWGGIQPPWVYSILALHLEGYPLDHPVLKKGLEGLDSFAIVENGTRRFEACQSPVWDTCLSAVALRDAGFSSDHPALESAASWMLDKEVRVPGDWSVRRPELAPSGWSFEFENLNYPDLDDTAEVVLALDGLEHPRSAEIEASIERAIEWTFGMQCADGGFAAFDVDNTRKLCGELPFCDFGEVVDPPSADVTAHVIEMLARLGYARDPRTLRARDWLLREQERDGSWFGRWGSNYLYGTGAALPGLIEAGVPTSHRAIRRAVEWLESQQNPDGGWGEDPRSYDEAGSPAQGTSTASQSAWALLGLLSAGEKSEAVDRGIRWLADTQLTDGDWAEPEFTGTGFPGDFYIRYHLYRLNFPVMALGRYLGARA